MVQEQERQREVTTSRVPVPEIGTIGKKTHLSYRPGKKPVKMGLKGM